MSTTSAPFGVISTLPAVAQAIADASRPRSLFYVERFGHHCRWSPAHRGGPYPLLRETAKLLDVDYHTLVVHARAISPTGFDADGIWAGVSALDFGDETPPDASMVLNLDGPTSEQQVLERLADLFPPT
ncbi:MAG TPA: hypothetical protein VIK08_00015 [Candidatus Limnocylindrales bacterium]